MPQSTLIPRLHPREALGPEYLAIHGQLWSGSIPADFGQKPKKTSHACEPCRSRRIKCDGRKPTCFACTQSKRACEYSDLDRRRRGDKDVELDALREKVRGLEQVVACLKDGSDEEIGKLIKSIREGADPVASTYHVALPDQPIPVVEMYTPENLPPEDVVRLGLTTFYSGSFILFYVFEEEDARNLCDQVYRSGKPPSRMALSELCALSAIGNQYDGDGVSVSVMEALYRTASALSNDCLDEKPLRVMRVLVCLSMYAIMTKKYSARLSIAAGLQIARWARLDASPGVEGWIPWRKVYRTLVFLECWLSSTIGYQYDLTESEIEFTRTDIIEPHPTFENAIQAQMSAVGLIMASILQEIYNSKPVSFMNATRCSMRLDEWRQSLPPLMELSAITASETARYVDKHRRSLFLVHALYLGAKMLLYRLLLVKIASCKLEHQWTLDATPEEGKQLQLESAKVAKTCLRLLNLLNSGSHWLCISHAFAACNILLLDVAVRLLDRVDEGVEESLAVSQECMSILEDRCSVSRIAEVMLDDIIPLHEELTSLATQASTTTQTDRTSTASQIDNSRKQVSNEDSGMDAYEAFPSAVVIAVRRAIDLLGNPFRYERKFEVEDIDIEDN